MNPFQSLNLAIFAGTIAALLAGLARITSPIGDRPIVLWLFVAFISTLRDAYGFTFIALALSTAWIVVANLPDRYGKKDVGWAVTNTLLLVVFGAVYAADSPTGDMITSVAIGASIAIAVLDFILSKSIFELPVSS
jgi:hypothetical protein